MIKKKVIEANLKERRALEKQKKQQKKQLQTIRQSQPRNAEGYLNRGVKFAQLGKYNDALSDFNQAIQLNPKDAVAYNYRGNIYAEIKQYEQALEDYHRAIQLNPHYAGAYNNRGNVYVQTKQYEQALDDLQQAIQLNPNNDEFYHLRGVIYTKTKQYEQALKDFEQAIQLNPRNVRAYHNRTLLDEHQKLEVAHRQLTKEYKQLTKEYKEYQAEVEESKKFKYLSSMATAVAHEINQPVGIIRAATSAALSDIQDDLFQPTELEPLLNKIYAQTGRLNKIIESFRSFARGDRQHREIVNLNQVVTQTLDIFRAQFNHHNIILTATLEEMLPIPTAWANPFQLEEVLINLLTNAKDALEGTDHPQIEIKTWRKLTGETGIQVEDNGPGIAPEFLEKLFLPFESSKSTERGTGLGLHLSRKIIEAFGGTLNYTPRQGGGASFQITFPPFSQSEELNNG